MIGITYGIEPYGGHTMGWTSPTVLAELGGGVALLVAFCVIETRVADPMFRLPLFKIRAFTFGTLSTFLSAVGRGGLMFMLIIWLQGIWLPLHGYSFDRTPLWAGIYMLPLTAGFLIAGPISGYLSDRYGARPFATGGMIVAAAQLRACSMLLPVDFSYSVFASILLLNGLAMGAFAAPNRAGVMNSLPPERPGRRRRDELDLPELRPGALDRDLLHPDDRRAVRHAAHRALPRPGGPRGAGGVGPSGVRPAAGVDPLRGLPRLQPDPAPGRALGAGPSLGGPARRGDRPELLPVDHRRPFHNGLHAAFDFAIVACLVAAAASWLRGGRYIHESGPAEVPAGGVHRAEATDMPEPDGNHRRTEPARAAVAAVDRPSAGRGAFDARPEGVQPGRHVVGPADEEERGHRVGPGGRVRPTPDRASAHGSRGRP